MAYNETKTSLILGSHIFHYYCNSQQCLYKSSSQLSIVEKGVYFLTCKFLSDTSCSLCLPVTAKLFSIIIFYYFYLNCPATQYHYSQPSNCLYFSKRSKRKFAVNRLHFPVGGSLNLYDKFCLLHSSESIYL